MYGFYLVLSLYSPSLLNIPWYMSSEPNKNKHTCKGKKKKKQILQYWELLILQVCNVFSFLCPIFELQVPFFEHHHGWPSPYLSANRGKNVTRDILAWSLLSFKLRSALPSFFTSQAFHVRSCFPSIFFFSAFTFSLFRTHYIRKHSSLKLCTPFF